MLGKFSRRHFCEACEFFRGWNGGGACAGGRGWTRARQPAAASFPNGFVLGAATSAYQIEGAVHRRVPSSAYSSVTNQIIA